MFHCWRILLSACYWQCYFPFVEMHFFVNIVSAIISCKLNRLTLRTLGNPLLRKLKIAFLNYEAPILNEDGCYYGLLPPGRRKDSNLLYFESPFLSVRPPGHLSQPDFESMDLSWWSAIINGLLLYKQTYR